MAGHKPSYTTGFYDRRSDKLRSMRWSGLPTDRNPKEGILLTRLSRLMADTFDKQDTDLIIELR